MSKKKAFQQLILDFFKEDMEPVKARAFQLPLDVPKVISLMGPRRSGKTYMLLETIQRLRESLPINRIVYVNLEDDRLFPLTIHDMDDLIQGYYELFPENREHIVYFFLDEIQEVKYWEKFVRRIYDKEKSRVYVTGSSSSVLGKEIATGLRGRTLPYEVLPLSYSEFLAFNDYNEEPRSSHGMALAINLMQKYLIQGGFPELVFADKVLHQKTVESYLEIMMYKDLVERYKISQPQLIKYLMKYLMSITGRLLSINKMHNDLRSQGYNIGRTTIYEYIAHMEDAYMIVQVPLWTHSIRKQRINPTKMYAIDPAFKRVMSIGEDWGQLCEQVVCLELKRRGYTPYYWKGKQEVDFFTEETGLINVCYDLSEIGTRERELKGLLEGMKALDQKESLLISWDQEEEVELEGYRIGIVPLWRWLMGV
jgi:predicted AAA+ superfamily ATPase